MKAVERMIGAACNLSEEDLRRRVAGPGGEPAVEGLLGLPA